MTTYNYSHAFGKSVTAQYGAHFQNILKGCGREKVRLFGRHTGTGDPTTILWKAVPDGAYLDASERNVYVNGRYEGREVHVRILTRNGDVLRHVEKPSEFPSETLITKILLAA